MTLKYDSLNKRWFDYVYDTPFVKEVKSEFEVDLLTGQKSRLRISEDQVPDGEEINLQVDPSPDPPTMPTWWTHVHLPRYVAYLGWPVEIHLSVRIAQSTRGDQFYITELDLFEVDVSKIMVQSFITHAWFQGLNDRYQTTFMKVVGFWAPQIAKPELVVKCRYKTGGTPAYNEWMVFVECVVNFGQVSPLVGTVNVFAGTGEGPDMEEQLDDSWSIIQLDSLDEAP